LWLFNIFYNKPQELSKTHRTLRSAVRLITLADQYCCLSSIADAVELEFWKNGANAGVPQELARYPFEYLQMACKIRSKRIYHDAFVHLVGMFDGFWDKKDQLPSLILTSVLNEYHRISKLKSSVDRHVSWLNATLGDRHQFGDALRSFMKHEYAKEGQMYRDLQRHLTSVMEGDVVPTPTCRYYVDTAALFELWKSKSADHLSAQLSELASDKLKIIVPGVSHNHLTCASTMSGSEGCEARSCPFLMYHACLLCFWYAW
jgi:hypothetical protein